MYKDRQGRCLFLKACGVFSLSLCSKYVFGLGCIFLWLSGVCQVGGELSSNPSFPELNAFSVPSVPREPGHLGMWTFCRRNLEMCRCWEAGLCTFWQFPSTELHWRQAKETEVWGFILMSTFLYYITSKWQIVKSWHFPACTETVLVSDKSGRYYSFSRLYIFPPPRGPEIGAAVSGSSLQPCQGLAEFQRVTDAGMEPVALCLSQQWQVASIYIVTVESRKTQWI